MVYALPDFTLYSDTSLTTPVGGTLQLTCKSDLSDNPQDFTYYFGAPTLYVPQVLQTQVSPGTNQIILTPSYILPEWTASTVVALGYSVIPTTPNGYRYVVTTAGTTDTTEPSWGVTINGTTSDGTAVWTLVAEDSPITEIILALNEADLDTNTPGASLSIGATIDSGVANYVEVWLRVTNTITAVSSSYATPEYGILINAVQQTSA